MCRSQRLPVNSHVAVPISSHQSDKQPPTTKLRVLFFFDAAVFYVRNKHEHADPETSGRRPATLRGCERHSRSTTRHNLLWRIRIHVTLTMISRRQLGTSKTCARSNPKSLTSTLCDRKSLSSTPSVCLHLVNAGHCASNLSALQAYEFLIMTRSVVPDELGSMSQAFTPHVQQPTKSASEGKECRQCLAFASRFDLLKNSTRIAKPMIIRRTYQSCSLGPILGFRK